MFDRVREWSRSPENARLLFVLWRKASSMIKIMIPFTTFVGTVIGYNNSILGAVVGAICGFVAAIVIAPAMLFVKYAIRARRLKD